MRFSEICIETPDNRLTQLGGFTLLGTANSWPLPVHDAFPELLRRVAEVLRGRGDNLPARALADQLLCQDADSPGNSHPWRWFSVTERTTGQLRPVRQVHEWGAYLRDDTNEIIVWFEHGLWGYRYERHAKLSDAFVRLAALLTDECTWLQFGCEVSRRSLLNKGQFYWVNPQTQENVPVDNFVFITSAGDELTLAGVGGRAVLSVRPAGQDSQPCWHDDYSPGLCWLADLIEGRRALNAPDILRAAPSHPLTGQFVVKCIYADRDVLAAPQLCFCTALGQQAQLDSAGDTWRVTYAAPGVPPVREDFEGAPGEALRHLAKLLAGEFPYTETLTGPRSPH